MISRSVHGLKEGPAEIEGLDEYMGGHTHVPVTFSQGFSLHSEMTKMVSFSYQDLGNTCRRAQDPASTRLLISQVHSLGTHQHLWILKVKTSDLGFSKGQISGNRNQHRKTTLSQFENIRHAR